jgi:hypothetical protein
MENESVRRIMWGVLFVAMIVAGSVSIFLIFAPHVHLLRSSMQ